MSSRFRVGLAIAVVLVVNVAIVNVAATRAEDPERAARELIMLLQAQVPDNRDEKLLDGIGRLARPHWKAKLSLTPGQAETLNKLDKLVWDGRTQSWLSDAEYVESHPHDYQAYMAKSHARRRGAPDHARSMVCVGLLSEPQAAAVTRTTLSARRYWLRILRDTSYLQDLIGITEAQLAELKALGKEQLAESAKLNWFATDPKEQDAASAKLAALEKNSEVKVEKILTKQQLELLDQLTKESNSNIEQPHFLDLTDDATAKIRVEEMSATFRNLAALDLTPEQRRLVSDLNDVVRQGFYWIGTRELSDEATVRSKFIQHAEQVALQGILTQQQADQVQAKLGAN